jgi:hypothetical protein
MPTKRAWGLLILAIGLYFLANQTQVGWVYLMSDGLLGLLIVTFFYTGGMLGGIQVNRLFRNLSPVLTQPAAPVDPAADSLDVTPPAFYEEDPIETILQFQQTGLRPALLVSGEEFCPFAPPADQGQPLFVPSLFRRRIVELSYQTTCDRRGLYTFTRMRLASTGPFGLFSVKRALNVSSQILIYPHYFPLKRLRLLETRQLAERQTTRLGVGTQVVSTREYRPGDSLRQIHWRSTAKVGELVVKEFAEEDQPSLTVALDLEATGLSQDKFSPFETAIRLAASFSYYASRQNMPFRLAAASPKWTPPVMPLSWWASLTYLAKAQNDGPTPLVQLLAGLPATPFLVVLVSRAYPALAQSLVLLPRRGIQTLVIFITPDGAMPAEVKIASATGLAVKSVSPHNWIALLEEL